MFALSIKYLPFVGTIFQSRGSALFNFPLERNIAGNQTKAQEDEKAGTLLFLSDQQEKSNIRKKGRGETFSLPNLLSSSSSSSSSSNSQRSCVGGKRRGEEEDHCGEMRESVCWSPSAGERTQGLDR